MRHINDKFSSKKNNFHVLCNMYDESKNIIHDLVLQQIAAQIVHRIKLGKLRWIIKVHIDNWYICIYSRKYNFLNKICLVLFFFHRLAIDLILSPIFFTKTFDTSRNVRLIRFFLASPSNQIHDLRFKIRFLELNFSIGDLS